MIGLEIGAVSIKWVKAEPRGAVQVDIVPAAPAEEGPWWARTAATIGRALADAVGGLAD